LTSAKTLLFDDGAASWIPDGGPIAAGSVVSYRPGSVYAAAATTSLPAPAPPAPYGSAFVQFFGEPIQGVWRLWVSDSEGGFAGRVESARITFGTSIGAPIVTMDEPTRDPTFTSTQPFVRVSAQLNNVDRPVVALWRNEANGAFYDSGSMAFEPLGGATLVAANIPVKQGSNHVRVRVISNEDYINSQELTINVNEFAYSLAEGATGGFFDTDVTIGNPTDAGVPVRVDFLREGAAPITRNEIVGANAPLQLHLHDLVPAGAVSTVVHSTSAIPLAVERTMSWDSTGYGGSGSSAIAPNTTWLFAEGSQGYFDTYLLLANDNDTDVTTSVRFLLEGGSPLDGPLVVPAHKRVTLYAGDIPGVINRSFGISVTSPLPITAERAMYFPHGSARLWEGGHEAAGVNRASTHWYLAEGATGPFFECFVLLSNPSAGAAHVTLVYLLQDGTTIPQVVEVPANGRMTIDVETVDPRLANAAVSTVVTSDVGIVVERSMYWPDISIGWLEAHNSPGVVDPVLRWGVSDIRVGGERGDQTFILLANPNVAPAEVQLRLLRPGAAPIARLYTLTPTSRTTVQASELAGPGIYSAEVQSLNYQPIVVEKALYWNSGGVLWAAGTGVVGTPLPPR